MSTYRVTLQFADADGVTRNYSYNNASASPSGANVKTAMNAMIANKEIFKYPPVSIKGAYVTETGITSINIPD